MVTYSDLVTLLLTFFVLLLSMARLDAVKLQRASGSLKEAFGVTRAGDQTTIEKPKVINFAPIMDDVFSRLYVRIDTNLKRLKIDQHMELVKDRGAIVLRVKDNILFGPGEAKVKDQAKEPLRKVAELIEGLPLSLRIEGHTDNKPSAKKDYSNWNLSADRAINVLAFFAQEELIPLDRMSAVGYADKRPLVPNISDENRALNRRVEFVLESIGSNRDPLPYLMDVNNQLPF